MKASLADQIAFLQRIVNPNYLIIIKNKADDTMDFSQFKAVIPEEKIKKVKDKVKDARYKITIVNVEPTEDSNLDSIIIKVEDLFFKRECFSCKTKLIKKEEIIKNLKRIYSGSSLEDVI